MLVYSTSEERLAIDKLGFCGQVERLYYHADQQFFRPLRAGRDRAQLDCAAGSCFATTSACRCRSDLPCACRSPRAVRDRTALEAAKRATGNVTWDASTATSSERSMLALRSRSCPSYRTYQTGIATILEMMPWKMRESRRKRMARPIP